MLWMAPSMKTVLENIKRPHWSELAARAGKIRDGYIGLDRNENLDEIYNKQLTEIIRNEIDLSKCNKYLDYCYYYEFLGEFYNINTANMLITAGCDEAIRLSFEAVFPGSFLSIKPSYRGAKTNASDLISTYYTVEENSNKIADAIEQYQPSLVYICSPNNPSGKVYSYDFLSSICSKYPKTYIFIDNTYADYANVCYHNLIKFENCLIGKSYSKGWGLAGMRFGLLLGHEKTIACIAKIRPIMSVSSITLELVAYLINNYSIVQDTIKRNKLGIDYIYEYFGGSRIYSRKNINHIVFDPPDGLLDKLTTKRVLYSEMSDYSETAIKLTTLPIEQFRRYV
jgi:histidinol-phosphate/aromatic aminotransferase/cobyric acid decarboxylase-like protein